MAPPGDEAESHSLRGAIDRQALLRFRDIVAAIEPLASATVDDIVDPTELNVVFDDGITAGATQGRFDVRWSTTDDYNIHYTEAGSDLRWDVHEHAYPRPDGDAHFHPPPDAPATEDAVDPSCLEVRPVALVARATIHCWRYAYEQGSLEVVNRLENPP